MFCWMTEPTRGWSSTDNRGDDLIGTVISIVKSLNVDLQNCRDRVMTMQIVCQDYSKL